MDTIRFLITILIGIVLGVVIAPIIGTIIAFCVKFALAVFYMVAAILFILLQIGLFYIAIKLLYKEEKTKGE